MSVENIIEPCWADTSKTTIVGRVKEEDSERTRKCIITKYEDVEMTRLNPDWEYLTKNFGDEMDKRLSGILEKQKKIALKGHRRRQRIERKKKYTNDEVYAMDQERIIENHKAKLKKEADLAKEDLNKIPEMNNDLYTKQYQEAKTLPHAMGAAINKILSSL